MKCHSQTHSLVLWTFTNKTVTTNARKSLLGAKSLHNALHICNQHVSRAANDIRDQVGPVDLQGLFLGPAHSVIKMAPFCWHCQGSQLHCRGGKLTSFPGQALNADYCYSHLCRRKQRCCLSSGTWERNRHRQRNTKSARIGNALFLETHSTHCLMCHWGAKQGLEKEIQTQPERG